MQYDVFISYSRKDSEVANRICAAFDEVGITYFIDRQGISGGENFTKAITTAIKGSKTFLFLASKNAYGSIYTNKEVNYAIKKKERECLIPYIIDDSELPDELELVLSDINWRRIEEHPVSTALVDDILRLLGKKRELRSESHTVSNPSPTPSKKKTYTVNGVSFTMINVKGGSFMMGSPDIDGDARDNEGPIHKVTLSDYSIGETQVTQELWKAVMGSNPSRFTGNLQCPVEQVSWNDCQTFIKKLNQLTGENFRLPTEAEWEYAARGGKDSKRYKYSGSNTIGDVAWYIDNSSSKTHPVKTKHSNELGIYDMSGNVLEWCYDWYGDYSSFAQTNPTGSSSGSYRVLRGGSWFSYAVYCRVAVRIFDIPSSSSYSLGLRLSLSPSK